MASNEGFLRDLVLYRNDPDVARRVREAALAGDLDAQYAMGLILAEGRGVEEDLVEAFAWLSVAVLNGDHDAEDLRYVVSERMTSDQFDRAQMRAGELELAIAGARPMN
jgi:TPR repeat protein